MDRQTDTMNEPCQTPHNNLCLCRVVRLPAHWAVHLSLISRVAWEQNCGPIFWSMNFSIIVICIIMDCNKHLDMYWITVLERIQGLCLIHSKDIGLRSFTWKHLHDRDVYSSESFTRNPLNPNWEARLGIDKVTGKTTLATSYLEKRKPCTSYCWEHWKSAKLFTIAKRNDWFRNLESTFLLLCISQ